jgi:hypothetical protein
MNSFLFFQDFLGFSILYREEEEKRKKKNHHSIYLRTCERNHRKTLNLNSEENFTRKKKATRKLFGKYPQKGNL